jgi:REP element-mobilizing transposase RayT
MISIFLGAPASAPASPWRSRGYIPHFDQDHLIQLVTFRLYDAVPEELIEQWKKELSWAEKLSASDPREVTLRKRIDKYEDAGHGECWLINEQVAALVEQTLLHFDGERCRIIAWCIMPNHVHVIVEIQEGFSLSCLMHSWKSYIAHKANILLNRSGKFWFREYHDRYIRDAEHLANSVEYVENNPVKAHLVNTKEEWRWSSAWKFHSRDRQRPAGFN